MDSHDEPEKTPTSTINKAEINKYRRNASSEFDTSTWLGKITWHPRFESFIITVICLNAITIGVEIELMDPVTLDTPKVLDDLEYFFFVIFGGEILMRVWCTNPRKSFITGTMKWWNALDSILVLMMILSLFVLTSKTIVNIESNEVEDGDAFDPKKLTTLRLLRLVRLTRLFRMFPELGIVVKSMAAAARSVSSMFIIIIFIMYIWSIILTQWAKTGHLIDEDRYENFFDGIGYSMLTLMQMLVFDDTFALIRVVEVDSLFIAILILIFICVGSFTCLNMLIGVICEIVSNTNQDEMEKIKRAEIELLFQKLDADCSGTITRQELIDANLKSGTIIRKMIGIDFKLLLTAFDIVDKDEQGVLDRNIFIQMIFKLLHPPETQDVLLILRKLTKLGDYLGLNLACTESEFNMQRDSLSPICSTESEFNMQRDSLDDDNENVMSDSVKSPIKGEIQKNRRMLRGSSSAAFAGKDPFMTLGGQIEDLGSLIKRALGDKYVDLGDPSFPVSGGARGRGTTMENNSINLMAVNDRVTELEHRVEALSGTTPQKPSIVKFTHEVSDEEGDEEGTPIIGITAIIEGNEEDQYDSASSQQRRLSPELRKANGDGDGATTPTTI